MIQKYKHYKGGIYIVLDDDVIDEETGKREVYYLSADTGKRYNRDYEEFFGFVEDTLIRRFHPIV